MDAMSEDRITRLEEGLLEAEDRIRDMRMRMIDLELWRSFSNDVLKAFGAAVVAGILMFIGYQMGVAS
jgi:hypothetical protein